MGSISELLTTVILSLGPLDPWLYYWNCWCYLTDSIKSFHQNFIPYQNLLHISCPCRLWLLDSSTKPIRSVLYFWYTCISYLTRHKTSYYSIRSKGVHSRTRTLSPKVLPKFPTGVFFVFVRLLPCLVLTSERRRNREAFETYTEGRLTQCGASFLNRTKNQSRNSRWVSNSQSSPPPSTSYFTLFVLVYLKVSYSSRTIRFRSRTFFLVDPRNPWL